VGHGVWAEGGYAGKLIVWVKECWGLPLMMYIAMIGITVRSLAR
jgi:hypothetical protein